MAKRQQRTARPKSGTTPMAASADGMERQLLAFAEQLGRIAGTVQARAEGWMDRDTLKAQIASVRDGAADLLEQLARRGTEAAKQKPLAAAAAGKSRGRSGGVVDAAGKRHRQPTPPDPDASAVGSQAAKMRAARTMVKTHRRRGRG